MRIIFLLMAALATAVNVLHAHANEQTTCAQLAAIARSCDASQHYFTVVATVTFLDESGLGFVGLQDDTGSVIALSAHHAKELRRGDMLRIQGTASRDIGPSATIHCAAIDVLSHGSPIAPIPAKADDIAAGKHDFMLISLDGIIRASFRDEIDRNFYVLSVVAGNRDFYVTIGSPSADMSHLVGSRVRITGVCEPRPHPNRKFLGRSIYANVSGITLIDENTADPFEAPTIDALVGLNPADISHLSIHQTSGHVLALWNGDTVAVMNTNGTLTLAHLASDCLPKVGDAIAVSGFPETDLYHVNLDHAVWKRLTLPAMPSIAATPISAVTVMNQGVGNSIEPRLHGETVKIRGVIRNLQTSPRGDGIVTIESDGFLVPIVIDKDVLASLVPGSIIEATGICIIAVENWRPSTPFPRITGFSVVTRTSSNIVIIAKPPWWTPARLLTVIGVLVAGLVAIFIWNISLRVLAERRGHALLKARIGNATEKLKVEERTRLAVELHDSLAQNLTGVSMEIESAENLSEGNSPEMRRHLSIAAKALKSCREDLRNCLFDLRSQALENPNLASAIATTLQPHLYGAKLSVRFNVPRKALYDNTVQALLKAIRELVINGVRHGKATEIKVAGEMDGEGLKCSVRDNGCGFDPDDCPGVLQGHFGLQGVRERIENLGGTVTLTSTLGKGTKAVIAIRSPGAKLTHNT